MSSYSYVFFDNSFNLSDNGNDGYEYFILDATNNNISINLLTSWYDGQTFILNRIDSSNNSITLNAQTGSTIDGTTSKTIGQKKYVEITMYNNNWIFNTF